MIIDANKTEEKFLFFPNNSGLRQNFKAKKDTEKETFMACKMGEGKNVSKMVKKSVMRLRDHGW